MEVNGTITGCSDDAAVLEPCVLDQEQSEKCSSGAAAPSPSPSPSTYLDCSICLDSAVDPVVTLCGHLYCWPCIYMRLQVETASPRQCPVCKGPLSRNALIPLFGQGTLNTRRSHYSLKIPNRPSSIASVIDEHHSSDTTNDDEYINLHPSMQQMQQEQQPIQDHHHPYLATSNSPFGSGVFQSTAGGVIGEIAAAFLPWGSRNQLLLANHGSSMSQRSQDMRVESALHQIWAFLLFCAVLCLLFF